MKPAIWMAIALWGAMSIPEVYAEDVPTKVAAEVIYDETVVEDSLYLLSVQREHELADGYFGMDYDFRYNLQLGYFSEKPSGEKLLLDLKEVIATGEKSWEGSSLKIGAQRVTWGENLLLPILDVVNPRDVTNPKGYYDSSNKLSVPMVQSMWLAGDYSLQLIYVPVTRKSKNPKDIGEFSVKPIEYREWSESYEYGFRPTILWGATEINLYYYNHWQRIPSFVFTPVSGRYDLREDEARVLTKGFSFSHSHDAVVVRGDVAVHDNFPATTVAHEVTRMKLIQGILGAEYATLSQMGFGLELHMDEWEHAPDSFTDDALVSIDDGPRQMQWLGTSVRKSADDWEGQAAYFEGLDNNDKLTRLKLTYFPNDDYDIDFELVKTEVNTTSPKFLLSQRKRVLLGIKHSF